MPEEKPTLDHEHLPTKLGTDFVAKFYRLLKGTTIYDRKNVNIDRLTQECLQVINSVVQSEGNLFSKSFEIISFSTIFGSLLKLTSIQSLKLFVRR